VEYELSIVVTIYPRPVWIAGLDGDPRPTGERRFAAELPTNWDDVGVKIVMRRLSEKVNKWIASQDVDLNTEVLVTVYSVEVK